MACYLKLFVGLIAGQASLRFLKIGEMGSFEFAGSRATEWSGHECRL
jgi:hypothetical protein